MALRLPTRERRMVSSTVITRRAVLMPRRACQGHLVAPLCVAALLAGCAGGRLTRHPPLPDPSAPRSQPTLSPT